MEREDLNMVSALLENIDNMSLLDMYLVGEIFVEKYTDAQLNDREKIKETVLKNIFPAYSKNNESQIVDKGQYRRAVREIKFEELYFNAYLLKVDDAWKIRKVDGDEVSYENVDGNNIMDLVEFLYAMSTLGDNKGDYDMLALIIVKNQIEEDLEKAGRYMMSYEKKFWDENDLGSDLIKKATQKIYTNRYFHLPMGENNRTAEFYGLYGEKMYGNFGTFGNVTYRWLLEHHLDTETAYMALNQLPYLRGNYMDMIKNKIGMEKIKSEDSFEQPQHVFETIDNHNSMVDERKEHQEKTMKMNSKDIKKTNKLPMKFSTTKLTCQAHIKKVYEKKKTGLVYWKPICNSDGTYSTTEKICIEKRCWCVDDQGIFLKQLYTTSENC